MEGGSNGSGTEKGDGGLGSDSRSIRAGRGDDADDSKSAWERIGHEHWRRTGAAGEARSGDHGKFESAARGRSAFDEAEKEDPMDMLDDERQFNMGKEWVARMWASEWEGVDSWGVDSRVDRETVASQKGVARRRVDEGRKEDQLDAYLDGIIELEEDKGGGSTVDDWWAKHFGEAGAAMEEPEIHELEEYAAPRQAVAGKGVPLPSEALFTRWTNEKQKEREHRESKW